MWISVNTFHPVEQQRVTIDLCQSNSDMSCLTMKRTMCEHIRWILPIGDIQPKIKFYCNTHVMIESACTCNNLASPQITSQSKEYSIGYRSFVKDDKYMYSGPKLSKLYSGPSTIYWLSLQCPCSQGYNKVLVSLRKSNSHKFEGFLVVSRVIVIISPS